MPSRIVLGEGDNRSMISILTNECFFDWPLDSDAFSIKIIDIRIIAIRHYVCEVYSIYYVFSL